MALVSMLMLSACGSKSKSSSQDTGMVDSTLVESADTTASSAEELEEQGPKFENQEEMAEWIKNGEEADSYKGGIMPVIAEYAPSYAERLLENTYNGFIVVDKASMRVLLYDKYGHEVKVYDMACAKNYGTKHKKADSRTPEGFFSVEGKYDSREWLFTDDNGVQSKKKGQFGPRFIRLKIPNTTQIGIHGTCSPWSVGHRVSHGCIRITNEQIMELVDLVEVGMPVIVLPGKRDRAVNRKEGYDIPYFPTAPKYAMEDSEKKLKPATAEEIREREEQERLLKELEEKKNLEQQGSGDTVNSVESVESVPETIPAEPAKESTPTEEIPSERTE